nr:hypothetical protein [Tanacetum cinerariifolium]
MRSLQAVGYTIHSMIKFRTNQGIVTMETSREALWESGKGARSGAAQKNIRQGKHRGNIHHQPRTSEPARNDRDHVDSQLQTVINKHAPGKHGGMRMGRIRKNYRTAIHHGASTKDIPSRQAGGP